MPPTPVEITLRKSRRAIAVKFDDGSDFELSAEYLRVHSPSAEVKGHGPGQERLVSGKADVAIKAVEPVGQYAVRLVFDDGHGTGLFTWPILYQLGREFEDNWRLYLSRLETAGKSR